MVIFLTIFVSFLSCQLTALPDPLSKIVVTSDKAHCQQDVGEKKSYLFSYQNNVKVTFADESKITADRLTISFSSQTSEKKTVLSHFKKIAFVGHVCMQRADQTIIADKADLDVQKQLCVLEGNVLVKQYKDKDKPKSIPVEMKSEKAIFHLKTEEVTFVGTTTHPVSTTIDLGQTASSPQQKRKKRKIRFF